VPAASYDLSDNIALVTGAGGDIGRAAALRLAASGARVVLTDLEEAADRLAESVASCAAVATAEAITVFRADLTEYAQVEACFSAAAERFGTPDLVFNNAGIQGAMRPTFDYPVDDFPVVLQVNVVGAFHVLREAARRLRLEGRAGSIVNSASMAGVAGAPNMVAYASSKGALLSMTRSAALDLAPSRIRVNAISPAFIGPGRMWDLQTQRQALVGSQYYPSDPDEVGREMVRMVPLRRLGTVDEVAAAVVWLLSEEASYVTGQNVIIAGGI
jgi:NAD(P)-dependent dehydrogenase (short-subunit alcohol dehydrogenase family)